MPDVRLIDANALKTKLDALSKIKDAHFLEGLQTAWAVVDVAPTIDAVEVVRCRECYYRDKPSCCPYQYSGFKVESDWYCPMGVKMDAKEEKPNGSIL